MSMLLFMLAAAASPTSLEGSRSAYTECLIDLTIDKLKEKATVDDFVTASKTACEAEKANFKAAVIKDERAGGSTTAESAEFADEEVTMTLEDMALGYADHLEFGTVPVKGK